LENYFSLKFEEEFLITFPKINGFISPKTEEIENFLFILLNEVEKRFLFGKFNNINKVMS